MALMKRAHIRGMAHELTRQGLVTWPSKVAMEEAADGVADDFSDEEVPEVTGEEGLTPEQASMALGKLVEVAEEIAEKTGGAVDEELSKTAASSSYEDAAAAAAIAVMEKAAAETAAATGPDVPGTTPPTPELGATAEAEIDASKTPSGDLVVPQGTSAVDTSPGAVGKEEDRDQPGAQASAPTGEVAKLSSLLTQMAAPVQTEKVAMDGASLSGGAAGGPAPAARVDLSDNLNIPGVVASSQGQTSQDVPATAEVGATKKQPAGTPGPTAATPNNPAKDAMKTAMETLKSSPQGQALLQKLSEEMKKEEDEKKKKEEEDEKKEAQVAGALQNLANALV